MFRLRRAAEEKAGHLLRLLLLRIGAMSAGAGGARLRKNRAVQPLFVERHPSHRSQFTAILF
jgi:hypothetical protein